MNSNAQMQLRKRWQCYMTVGYRSPGVGYEKAKITCRGVRRIYALLIVGCSRRGVYRSLVRAGPGLFTLQVSPQSSCRTRAVEFVHSALMLRCCLSLLVRSTVLRTISVESLRSI